MFFFSAESDGSASTHVGDDSGYAGALQRRLRRAIGAFHFDSHIQWHCDHSVIVWECLRRPTSHPPRLFHCRCCRRYFALARICEFLSSLLPASAQSRSLCPFGASFTVKLEGGVDAPGAGGQSFDDLHARLQPLYLLAQKPHLPFVFCVATNKIWRLRLFIER